MLKKSLRLCAWIFLGCTGCHGVATAPDLAKLYQKAAQDPNPLRNPVIVIPGIMGSRLVDAASQRLVWGAFTGDYADPGEPDGARLLAIPMEFGRNLEELQDQVYADGALRQIHVNILGIPISQAAYSYILGTLGVGGYRDQDLAEAGVIDYGDQHYTCFQFAYDWRLDLAQNAKRLAEYIEVQRAAVQKDLEESFGITDHDVKFDVVAHSMGSLLLRYFLRYGAQDLPEDGSLPELSWEGAQRVERAVCIAPPNSGSLNALTNLVEGVSFSFLLPTYSAPLLGTLPSIYQLLPRSRHQVLKSGTDDAPLENDLLDPDLWRQLQWGLAAPDADEVLNILLPDIPTAAERRSIALDHQAKCLRRARQIQAALDIPANRPSGLELYLVAGDAENTPSRASVNMQTGELEIAAYGSGDGTVLRSSALGDERIGAKWQAQLRSPIDWTQVLFLFTDHLGLTSDPAFTDNLLYLLLESPR